MTYQYDPSPVEEQALHAAQRTLGEIGIAPGPKGYDLDALAAAVYAHGGSYGINMTLGWYPAEIRPQQANWLEPRSVATAWTPAAALTFAIVEALTSDATIPEDDTRETAIAVGEQPLNAQESNSR